MKKNKINKARILMSKFLYKLSSLSFAKHIITFYFFITIIGSLFLLMPLSHQPNVKVKYIDTLFTAASAFSDTGLVTLTTSSTWSSFGQAIIAILILVGGIGWFALKVYFFNILLGRSISFKVNEVLSSERGGDKVGNTKQIIKISVTILFILLLISSIVLTLYFYFNPTPTNPFNTIGAQPKLEEIPYQNASVSLKWGIFHSISALNNAGFDIMGPNSLQPYYKSYALQIIFIILFVIGGIGYPVIHDLYLWIRSKIYKESFKWTLFTKLSMITYISITIIGLMAVFTNEIFQKNTDSNLSFWNNPYYGSKGNKTMAIIFNTFSTRNAGFATVDLKSMSSITLIIYSIMMFIGSAPSSTAGGIRTTTIAIIFLSLWSRIRGKGAIRAFNRKIPSATVERSFTVLTTALILVIGVWLISMSSFQNFGGELSYAKGTEKSYNNIHLLFEVASAFGTTGLSTGLTKYLSIASKLSLIIIMFVGQLGVSSSLLAWNNKNNKATTFSFIEEDVSTG